MSLDVNIEDTGKHGPKFLALPNDKWRRFVLALFNQGVQNYTKAYEAAGFKGDHNTLRSNASRMAHDTRVQEAIFEEAQRTIKGLVPLALHAMKEMLEDPLSKDRGKMVLSALDRGGLHGVIETKTTIEHIGQDPDRMKRLVDLAVSLGMSNQELLGERLAKLAPPVEVVVIEVEKCPE